MGRLYIVVDLVIILIVAEGEFILLFILRRRCVQGLPARCICRRPRRSNRGGQFLSLTLLSLGRGDCQTARRRVVLQLQFTKVIVETLDTLVHS